MSWRKSVSKNVEGMIFVMNDVKFPLFTSSLKQSLDNQTIRKKEEKEEVGEKRGLMREEERKVE